MTPRSPLVSGRRGNLRRWAPGTLALALGCGSRTALEVTAAAPALAAHVDAGPVDAGRADAKRADASSEATPASTPDASDAHASDGGCGATWLLFALTTIGSEGGVTGRSIYARRVDGTGGHVVALPYPLPISPSVSADGSALVYSVETYGHIYIHDFTRETDTDLPVGGTTLDPVVSPDGAHVAYDDGYNVWLAPSDNSATPTLLAGAHDSPAGERTLPAFTADSQRVVFAAPGTVDSVALDGSGRTTLVGPTGGEGDVIGAFSPDFQGLAVSLACDGADYALRTFPVASLPAPCDAGSVIVAVTPWIASYSRPAWGPDGLFAFADEEGNLMLVTGEGSSITNFGGDLTGGQIGSAASPAFAPACTPL